MAMRAVILEGTDTPTPTSLQGTDLTIAGLLVHVVAERLDFHRSPAGRVGPGGRDMLMALVPNQLFNEHSHPGDRLAQARLLWTRYGSQIQQSFGFDPAALIEHAMTVTPEELWAWSFALFATAIGPAPGVPALRLDTNVMDMGGLGSLPDDVLVSTLPRLREAFTASPAADSPWDLLPFVVTPVLLVDEHAVVLDTELLIDRVTSGMFWVVHDHATGPGTGVSAQKWRQAWAVMIELLAEEIVADTCSATPGATMLTEEDFGVAYPKSKRADIGVIAGHDVLLMEVFSGSPTYDTRYRARYEAFERDMDKMILDKAEQLHGTATNVLLWPQKPDSPIEAKAARVLPVVVHHFPFPVSPHTMKLVREQLSARGLLRDPRVMGLSAMTLTDLELLWRITHSTRANAFDALRHWRRDATARDWSFTHYYATKYAMRGQPRWPPLQSSLDDLLTHVEDQLTTTMDET